MKKSESKRDRIFIQVSLFLVICLFTTLRWYMPSKLFYYKGCSFLKNLDRNINDFYMDKDLTVTLKHQNGTITDLVSGHTYKLLGVLSDNFGLYRDPQDKTKLMILSCTNNEIWVYGFNQYNSNFFPKSTALLKTKGVPSPHDLKKIATFVSDYPLFRFASRNSKKNFLNSSKSIENFINKHHNQKYVVSIFENRPEEKYFQISSHFVEFEDQHLNIPKIGKSQIIAVIGDNECVIKKKNNKMQIVRLDFHHVYLSQEYRNISSKNYEKILERKLLEY